MSFFLIFPQIVTGGFLVAGTEKGQVFHCVCWPSGLSALKEHGKDMKCCCNMQYDINLLGLGQGFQLQMASLTS